MTWVAAVGAGVSLAGGLANQAHAKDAASAQAALGKKQREKLRERFEETSKASEAEISTLRNLRALDLPAFRKASEQALLQAKKGSERMARHVTMSRQPSEVRDAIFGGEFQQYVGRETQRMQHHVQLTQQILQATNKQQEMAMQVEAQGAQMEYSAAAKALEMEAAAGSTAGSILGAVGAGVSAYASGAAADKKATTAREAAELSEQKWMELSAARSGTDISTLPSFGGGATQSPPNWLTDQDWFSHANR